jgi:hypothetical protein
LTIDNIDGQFSYMRETSIRMDEETGIRSLSDIQINSCKQLQSNLNYFDKTNQNNDLFCSGFAMPKQDLDDEEDEDIAIRNSVRELKRIYKTSSNSSRSRNEILKSVEELKNDLSNDAKKGKMCEERIRNVFKKLNTKINQTQEKVLNEMDSLPEEEQEQIATFWEISGEFLTKLLDWFLIKYKKIVKQIKKGASYAIKKIKEIIGSATIWIKDAYNN